MNCAEPTDFCFSFSGFRLRGGLCDKHSDGWGLAIYEGRGVRLFLDDLPAAESPLAELVSRYPIKTLNMMAHIRYATMGRVCLENVHPFQREMWGIIWVFSHNGDVPKFSPSSNHPHVLGKVDNLTFRPVGDTDSESIFCAILNHLNTEFDSPPILPVLYDAIQRICKEIIEGEEQESIFNFLLGCGQYTLFAYSWPGSRPGSDVWNGLYYTIRQPPFTTAKLADIDFSMDFSTVTTSTDRVAVIATKPLTCNESWIEIKRGELIMFDRGLPFTKSTDVERVEQEGRGLRKSGCVGRGVGTKSCISSNSDPLLNGRVIQKNEIMIPHGIDKFDNMRVGYVQENPTAGH